MERRTKYVYEVAGFFLLIGFVLSFPLWHSERTFPLLPYFEIIPVFPILFQKVYLYFVLFCLISGIFFKNRKAFLIFFVLFCFLLLQDQMRWQAWVYIYFLLLFPFIFHKPKKDLNLTPYFQVILIGIYFWSGFHKLQATFIENTFVSILENLFRIKDASLIELLKPIGYAIPILEMLTALFLFSKRFRSLGVVIAIGTHIFVLLYLSPIGVFYNSIVYPWNVAMIGFVLLLFYKNDHSIFINILSSTHIHKWILTAVLISWLLPILNLFGLWDHYLSFSLYSNKPKYYYIEMEKEKSFDDANLDGLFKSNEKLTKDKKYLDLNDWTISEMNVPFYPQDRLFKQLVTKICVDSKFENVNYLVLQKNKNQSNLEYIECP